MVIVVIPQVAEPETDTDTDCIDGVLSKDLYKGPIENQENQPMHQENPKLIEMIKEQILPAAPADSKLILSNEKIGFGQIGQVSYIVDYFKNKTGGFFLEAGATDGEELSNTLYLESVLSWTGLLIEPNKNYFKTLKTRNRKSKLLQSGISLSEYPEEVIFEAALGVGSIQDSRIPDNGMKAGVAAKERSTYPLQCYPFFSILLALDNHRIDFLSLDIEGAEQAVLETIPWHKANIQTILLEVEHSDKTAIVSLLKSAGYRIEHKFGKQDIFFVKQTN